jgi:hypothetical protein
MQRTGALARRRECIAVQPAQGCQHMGDCIAKAGSARTDAGKSRSSIRRALAWSLRPEIGP